MSYYLRNIEKDFVSSGGTVNLNDLCDKIILSGLGSINYIKQDDLDIYCIFETELTPEELAIFDEVISTYSENTDYNKTDTTGLDLKINVVKDIKPNGTNGGSADTSTKKGTEQNFDSKGNPTWITRELNTIEGVDVFINLVNNVIIVPAGVYFIKASAPAQNVTTHQIRLRNITTSSNLIIGTSAYSAQSVTTNSEACAFITLPTTTEIELQHRFAKAKANDGMGMATGFGEDETYSYVEIQKLN